MSELTDLVEQTPWLELLSPADGGTTETIRSVFVIVGKRGSGAVITDVFETWEPNPDNSTQDYLIKRFAELRDDEILDALKLASKVGDDLEAKNYRVKR